MQKLRLICALLFATLSSYAQIASPTLPGVIRIGTGLSVNASGVVSVTAVDTFSQSTTYVTTKTTAGIQAAIDAVADGSTLVFSGPYDLSAGNVTITGKRIRFVSFNATFDGGTANHVLLIINNTTGVLIEGIKFISSNTGSGYSMVLLNEVNGPTSNVTINRCEFVTASTGSYNAISDTPYSEASSTGYLHLNIAVTNCYGHNLNRMFLEVVSHNWTGSTYYGENYIVLGNTVYDTGLNSDDGMGVSFSGLIRRVIASNNILNQIRGYGIEFIGTDGFTATNNIIISTKTKANGDGTNGYNITDGNNTVGGTPNKGAKNGSIVGGRVEVSGRPFLTYYASDIELTGGTWKGIFTTLQNSTRISLTGLKFESTYQTCLYFDGTTNSIVTGGTYNTSNAPDPKYQQIAFVNSSSGNYLNGPRLIGSPANGVNVFPANDPNNTWLVYVEGGGVQVNGMLDTYTNHVLLGSLAGKTLTPLAGEPIRRGPLR